MVNEPSLPFPEGRAIAEVLKVGADEGMGLKDLILGGAVGAAIELAQTGLKIIANSWQVWFVAHRGLFGFGGGFSATMIGAGYLIGFDICMSIFVGAVIGWLITVPIVSELFPEYLNQVVNGGAKPTAMVMALWGAKIRYIGIGAMLLAGLWTLLGLLKPFYDSVCLSLGAFQARGNKAIPRTERDAPMGYVIVGVILTMVGMFFYFRATLPLSHFGFASFGDLMVILTILSYLLLFGFIFSAITGYFSGLVGVTATPGSSIIIAGMLIAALGLRTLISMQGSLVSHGVISDAEAITIIIGAVITGAAAIANDNIQDLKVGHILGSTPWKQQLMLLLGVVVSALVIPIIMQLLFDVYGIADVLPHPGMDPSVALPAPPAALLAGITEGVFHHNLPWNMVYSGFAIGAGLIFAKRFVPGTKSLSILGVAIGIYLPLASSIPIFIGGMIAYMVKRKRFGGNTCQKHFRQTDI